MGPRFGKLTAWLMLAIAFPATARADSLCDYYRKNQKEMYKLLCDGGHTSAKPAGANSTFSSSFNLNSASLPTEPSSYGLETLLHSLRSPTATGATLSPTFSIVKGFKKFGTGISTGSNSTFYGDDVVQRAAGSPELSTFDALEEEKGSLPNLNIGTALDLYRSKRGPSFRLGVSGRYNKITDTWGGGPALLVNWGRFSVGAGFTREKVSNLLDRTTFVALQASVRLWVFEFQYDRLSNDAAPLDLDPIHVFTTTLTIKRLILTGAVRRLNYLRDGEVGQSHFAVQYLFSKHLSAGFLFNYVPGANSLGVQYYL